MTSLKNMPKKMKKKMKKKIFLGWSGERSGAIAVVLRDWLDEFFDKKFTFEISKKFRSGKKWRNELFKTLNSVELGIFCLTQESLKSTWIHFELGVLTARKKVSMPLLWDVTGHEFKDTPLTAPLTDSQSTQLNVNQIESILMSIVSSLKVRRGYIHDRCGANKSLLFEKINDALCNIKTPMEPIESCTANVTKFTKLVTDANAFISKIVFHQNYVLPWGISSDQELRSQELCAITSDLTWLLLNARRKADDVLTNPDHARRYLINPINGQRNVAMIDDKLYLINLICSKTFDEYRTRYRIVDRTIWIQKVKDFNRRFRIVKLSDEGLAKKIKTLPLIGDLALYQGIQEEREKGKIINKIVIGICSPETKELNKYITTFVQRYRRENNPNKQLSMYEQLIQEIDQHNTERSDKFDIQTEDKSTCKSIKRWFENVWAAESIKSGNGRNIIDIPLNTSQQKR